MITIRYLVKINLAVRGIYKLFALM